MVEGGKVPLLRRLVGSLGCAVLVLYWMFGIDRLTLDASDVVNFSAVLAIIWIVAYRAWPAVEITWDFFASAEARRAFRPTWPHLLGALGLSLGLVLVPALFLVTLSWNIEADPGTLLLRVLLYAVIFYIAWPAIVMKWRRLRTRSR